MRNRFWCVCGRKKNDLADKRSFSPVRAAAEEIECVGPERSSIEKRNFSELSSGFQILKSPNFLKDKKQKNLFCIFLKLFLFPEMSTFLIPLCI